MTDHKIGPPMKFKKPSPAPPGLDLSTGTNGQQTANIRNDTGIAREMRLRRAASRRLPGGDPWGRHEPIGERGYPEAVAHLLEVGLLPAVDREGLGVMWKRGGSSRQTAEFIADAWGLAS